MDGRAASYSKSSSAVGVVWSCLYRDHFYSHVYTSHENIQLAVYCLLQLSVLLLYHMIVTIIDVDDKVLLPLLLYILYTV